MDSQFVFRAAGSRSTTSLHSFGGSRILGSNGYAHVDKRAMRRAAPVPLLRPLVLGGSTASALRSPPPRAVPSSRSRTRGTSAWTRFRSPPNSAEIVRSIGANGERPRRLRLRALGRRADRDPVSRSWARSAASHASPSSTPTSPTAARTRSRAASRSRAAASTGDRHAIIVDQHRVPPLRARTRLYAEGRWLDGGLGRDLEPALQPAAPRGLDVGRRRRAADLPRASRATTRSSAA